MIRGIQNPALEKLAQQAAQLPTSTTTDGGSDFAQMLMDVLKEVDGTQAKAKEMSNDFMTGRRSVDYQDLMIAMERASTTMNLTVAVRNKLLEAYQEINRMQV